MDHHKVDQNTKTDQRLPMPPAGNTDEDEVNVFVSPRCFAGKSSAELWSKAQSLHAKSTTAQNGNEIRTNGTCDAKISLGRLGVVNSDGRYTFGPLLLSLPHA